MKKNTKSKTVTAAAPAKQHRGFRAMRPEMQRKIATLGGKAVAKQRGSKHMARIGFIGGSNSHRNTNAKG